MKNDKEVVRKAVERVNELLASEIPQFAKRKLCMLAESLLNSVNAYRGFDYNYWREKGSRDWLYAGEPDFPEKLPYIIGAEGLDNGYNDKYVSDVQGEYARYYHTSKLNK